MKKLIKNKIFILALLVLTLIVVAIQLPLTADFKDWVGNKFNGILTLLNMTKKENTIIKGAIYLNEREINAATGKNGYVIDKPGKYIFSQDINWAVATPDSFAITIAANNVTLDGDGHFIKQIDNTIKHAIGIQAKVGFHDIKIQNIKLDSISGGGVWFRGNNSNLTVKDLKTNNCGYFGMTRLDSKKIGPGAPAAMTQGILFDGGHGRPIENAQVINCVFVESGILRTKKTQYEIACGAIAGYQASNIAIKGCTIDGCIGRDVSWGMTLANVTGAIVSDLFVTDIFSSRNSKGIYTNEVDGELQDTLQVSIDSNVSANQFAYFLDNHANPKDPIEDDSTYVIEVNHLRGVVPKHREKEIALFNEHKWREFRTLYRLVSHNSHGKSKTSGIYSKWVELFCDRVLGVKVIPVPL